MAINTNQLSHKDHPMKFISAMLLVVLAPLAQAHGPEAHAKPSSTTVEDLPGPGQSTWLTHSQQPCKRVI